MISAVRCVRSWALVLHQCFGCSSVVIPKTRTSYGKFSLKFQGTVIRNKIPDNIKGLNRNSFKKKVKINYTVNYWQDHICIISVLKEILYFVNFVPNSILFFIYLTFVFFLIVVYYLFVYNFALDDIHFFVSRSYV